MSKRAWPEKSVTGRTILVCLTGTNRIDACLDVVPIRKLRVALLACPAMELRRAETLASAQIQKERRRTVTAPAPHSELRRGMSL